MIFLLGFLSGIITITIIHLITYKIYYLLFKKIGKKLNLDINRCNKCKNYFYTYRKSIKICYNCLLLQKEKNILIF